MLGRSGADGRHLAQFATTFAGTVGGLLPDADRDGEEGLWLRNEIEPDGLSEGFQDRSKASGGLGRRTTLTHSSFCQDFK